MLGDDGCVLLLLLTSLCFIVVSLHSPSGDAVNSFAITIEPIGGVNGYVLLLSSPCFDYGQFCFY